MIVAEPDLSLWPCHVDLAQALAELGIGSTIAMTGPAPSDAQRAAAAAVPGLTIVDSGLDLDPREADSASFAEAGRHLARLAKALDADLVQLGNAALAAEAPFGCPVVILHSGCAVTRWEAVHDSPLPAEYKWRADLIRAGLKAASAVVAPTDAHAELVQRRYGLAETPRTVNIGRTPLELRSSAPHDCVLTAGRLWDESSNLRVLDAAASRIGVPIRAAGPVTGPNGVEVVFDHLHCLGSLEESEIGRWLSARPVFVSTALYEPVGLSVLAAASAGCALILSDIPSFRELWAEVAVFVDPRDERGYSETIANLVGDDFERAVLGRAARERAALYSPQAMAAQMAAIYRSLLPAVNRPVLAARAAA